MKSDFEEMQKQSNGGKKGTYKRAIKSFLNLLLLRPKGIGNQMEGGGFTEEQQISETGKQTLLFIYFAMDYWFSHICFISSRRIIVLQLHRLRYY